MSQATVAHTTTRKTALDRAHAELIARIAETRPPRIHGAADMHDAESRAAHLLEIYSAAIDYLEAVVAGTVKRLPVARGCRFEVEQTLWDQVNGGTYDLAGMLTQAGCRFAS